MERRKKALICLFLLVSLIFPRVKIVKAEALPTVEVMESTATIADMVMTYYAESGIAVANTDWINSLYNDLGTNFGTVEELAQQGLLVLNENTGYWESTAELATAIENTSAYASLGLNDIFSVSAQEAAEIGGGAVAAAGSTVLANSAAGVASVGVVPLLGAVSLAYWGGIAAGTLVSHLIDDYIDNVMLGVPIDFPRDLAAIKSGLLDGGVGTFSNGSEFYIFTIESGNVLTGYYTNSEKTKATLCIYNPSRYNYLSYKFNSSSNGSNFNLRSLGPNGQSYAAQGYNVNGPDTFIYSWPNLFNNSSEYDSAKQNWYNDPSSAPSSKADHSPDLIGSNGNLETGEDQEGGITLPDVLPQIDTSTEAGKPLRLQDWLNFANQANTNTGAGQPDLNKDLFDDIMDRIRGLIPNIPDPSPDPGGETRPIPTPTPVPDPDYDVPQPEQPEWQSETTQQTEEVPDSIPTGKPWVVEGLQNKFPFCIPWDIKNMLGKFASASRQAPYIQWRFNPPFTPIDYTFQIDLADFEDAAAILRTLELIAFIVGLAFATRYLIGAS